MNRLHFFIVALASLIMLYSCKTYYIPDDSFKQQFAGLSIVDKKTVFTRGPGGDVVQYLSYPIDSIKCVDKEGHPAMLKNGPSIEIRFTDANSRKTIFYFDLIGMEDSSITGIQSRFMPSFKKTIPLNSIKKIEVQDGKKRFSYVQ